MTILLALLLIPSAFSQDFVFDKEKGRAVPSFVGQIKLLKGKAFKKNAEGTTEVQGGERFKKNDTLMTSEKSFARVLIVDDTQISLGPGSELKFEDIDFVDKKNRKLSFGLLKGQITGEVKNKAKAGEIEFKTKYTTMGVRGTHFLMNHQNKGSLHIAQYALLKGKIEVKDHESNMHAMSPGDKLVLVHDSSRSLSAKEDTKLSPKEFNTLMGVDVDLERKFRLFLPYFKEDALTSESPLRELFSQTPQIDSVLEATPRRKESKPHWKDNLEELNRKLRENQKRR